MSSGWARKTASAFITVVMVLAAFAVGIALLNHLGLAYPVKGRSMLPNIVEGDLVFIRPCSTSDVNVGDIVVYQRGDTFIIHRVIEKVVVGKEVLLRTKGDNNPIPDTGLVDNKMLRGVVILHLPALGILTIPPYNYLIALVLAFGIVYELTYGKKSSKS